MDFLKADQVGKIIQQKLLKSQKHRIERKTGNYVFLQVKGDQ